MNASFINILLDILILHFSARMIVVCLGLVFLCGCYGYPSGAPDSACNSMTPNHGVGPQNTSPPYVIKLSSSNFTAEENLTSMYCKVFRRTVGWWYIVLKRPSREYVIDMGTSSLLVKGCKI